MIITNTCDKGGRRILRLRHLGRPRRADGRTRTDRARAAAAATATSPFFFGVPPFASPSRGMFCCDAFTEHGMCAREKGVGHFIWSVRVSLSACLIVCRESEMWRQFSRSDRRKAVGRTLLLGPPQIRMTDAGMDATIKRNWANGQLWQAERECEKRPAPPVSAPPSLGRWRPIS